MVQFPRPDHRELYFNVTGPLPVIYYGFDFKLEAKCFLCGWSGFEWTEAECKAALSEHLWVEHHGVVPRSKNVGLSPGRTDGQ
jgi:hypothetical protein